MQLSIKSWANLLSTFFYLRFYLSTSKWQKESTQKILYEINFKICLVVIQFILFTNENTDIQKSKCFLFIIIITETILVLRLCYEDATQHQHLRRCFDYVCLLVENVFLIDNTE